MSAIRRMQAQAHMVSRDAVPIAIERRLSAPMYRQIYESIRAAIRDGRLPAGTRLPATRSLATQLSVSRKTVLVAFKLLGAEGLIEGWVGAGTWVSRRPDPATRAESPG